MEIDTHKCLIPLASASVSLVTCIMSIHHFRDFAKMMSEIKRVLYPHGHLFIREHDCPAENNKLVQSLTNMHAKFRDHRPDEPIALWGRRDLRVELSRNGFVHVCDSDVAIQSKNH